MAKKTVNKSEAIRIAFAETPAASTKEIIATLKQKGIDVNDNLVYGVKQALAKKTAMAVANAAAPAKVAAATEVAAPSSNGRLGIGAAIAVAKAAAEKLGGWAQLKEIVDAMV